MTPPTRFKPLHVLQWEHIRDVLAACDGNVSEAARQLGIARRSLQRKIAKWKPIKEQP